MLRGDDGHAGCAGGGLPHAAATAADCIYVDVDESGWVTSASGSGAGAVRALLAPDVHARNALLTLEAGGLRLRVLTAPPPHAPLLLWFDEPLLALVDMPFLTLRNIRGKKDYVCHNCNVQFERPNHLKVHLFLECREFSPALFWRRFHARLAAAGGGRTPQQLEALAAEWGRARGGHLCLYCGKLYSRKYGLKIHIRTHTGYKPLRCRYCLRAFGDPSNLNKHVRLHAASARVHEHACALCGKRLARRRDLLRHLRARHAT